jgi:hypothetical protein
MKEKYYYFREPKTNKPNITVCLIENDGAIARGVAICSARDNAKKKFGRKLARGRAIKAMAKKIDSCRVCRYDGFHALYKYTPSRKDEKVVGFKSMFNPELTDFEKKIMGV